MSVLPPDTTLNTYRPTIVGRYFVDYAEHSLRYIKYTTRLHIADRLHKSQSIRIVLYQSRLYKCG